MLTPLKILFTLAVIGAVLYGYRVLERAGKERGRRVGAEARRRTPRQGGGGHAAPSQAAPAAGDDAAVADLEPCATCGAYVVADQQRNCGRAGCPYPG